MKEKTKSSIIYLNRSQLEPHPDNPRKDLGDLEELRESIREHGIMQNLTVIPTDDTLEHFRILIGHRRFAASEGILTQLPCVIVEGLSNREQVGIMLCENIQRSDLTYIEQARGFQMMLDLGDTVETIADKTGFSEKTIKSRLEINKLDEETLGEASERFQLSIADFMKLSKIKDVEKRNEILESVDSSKDLAYEVDEYLEELTLETNFNKYKKVLDEVGWKEDDRGWFGGSDYERLPEFGYGSIALKDYTEENVQRIRDAAEAHEKDNVVFKHNYRGIDFAIKITKAQKKEKGKTKEELRQEAINKQAKALENARAEICDEYLRFILELTQAEIHALELTAYKHKLKNCIDILEKNQSTIMNFEHIYNVRTLIHEDLSIGAVYKQSDPLKKIFLEVWYELALSYRNKLVSYDLVKSGATLRAHQSFYSTLYSFGFRLPENLRAVIEGNSELYTLQGVKK